MIKMKGIRKEYRMGDNVLAALDGVDIHIKPHEFVSIIGPSGSGKSTLMNIIGCLDTADEGTYYLDDEETKTEESAAGIAETIQEDIVDRVNHGLDQILQNLTLADLEESFQERQSGGQEMYYI